jgi:aspartyl/asparaginyl beta-hydroxylase (cupin superfamily)
MPFDDLTPWLARIEAAQQHVRSKTGPAKLALYSAIAGVLSAPRNGMRPRTENWPALQKPWVPLWPSLCSRPVHDPSTFPGVAALKQAWPDIRKELAGVVDRFQRAAYDSDVHNKPWNTYYFYLRRRAVSEHLRQCPRTAEALAGLPSDHTHVCFSAIQPGGHLVPHTGATNTTLTLHLGVQDCAGATLWVGGEGIPYRDGEVLVFDDSYVHWVEHTGPRTRYTLMVSLWHPQLNAMERAFLRQVSRFMKT